MADEIKHKSLFQLSFPLFGKLVCGLPLFATFFCVVWSFLFNFEASTATHCRVRNYLPSVSSAIGGFTPQRYVWRICICLHATPRLMIAIAYYSYHTSVHVGRDNELYKGIAALASLFNILEVSSLVTLTYISSTDNHDVHESCFIVFMISALLYMMLSIYLMDKRQSSKGSAFTVEESKSLRLKKTLFATNISIFLLSVYLFFRHNWYCEPGVYTAFAACEYLVIVTNIAFHGTAIIDFASYSAAYVYTNLITAQTPSNKIKAS
uniref:CWH43-like N-terminal domain-containing protein n=1 Tax=Arion vulgaris TaxID=1028688 RepID=A0A0B7AH32_9EUPU